MPQISNFFGIIIRMFYDDHNPRHFHVQYGEYKCSIDIRSLRVLEGYLPARVLGLVIEWASINQQYLLDNWHNAEFKQPLIKIPPLQ